MVAVSCWNGTSIAARDAPADAAARLLLRSLSEAARACEAAVLRGEDPEALHDLRVATRRARSLLRPLREVFPAAALDPLRDGLRWLAELTGPARDLEVLLDRLDDALRAMSPADRRAFEPIEALARQEHAAARQQLLEGLRSARHRQLVAAWRGIAKAPPVAARPIGTIAAEAVDRAWRRLARHRRQLERSSAPALFHRARIDGKKLRYLLEIFQPIFAAADLDPVISRLKSVQDCLGELHDAWAEREALRRLARRLEEEGTASTATLLLTGRLIERAGAAQAAAEKRFAKRVERLLTPKNRRRIRALAANSAV